MRAEFKRDVSHNYLILHGEKTVDTASYQVRMLTGNVIPCILKCHLQNLDGEELFYYDITSKQSVSMLFEEKKFRGEDLQMIFAGFVRVMEELAEFLMNPEQLVLQPEYIYLDAESKTVYFCCLPGFSGEIQGQFRTLTEYILPKLDHEDSEAVMLGYGIYRKALEPGLQLEKVKAAIYQRERVEGKPETGDIVEDKEILSQTQINDKEYEILPDELPECSGTTDVPEKRAWNNLWRWGVCCGAGVLVILTILGASMFGVISWIPAETVIAVGILALAAGALLVWISEKKKRKKEDSAQWRKKIKKESFDNGLENVSSDEKIQTKEPENNAEKKRSQTEKGMTGTTGQLFDKTGSRAHGQEEFYGETVVLSAGQKPGPASLVSREPGELATIFLDQDLTVVGKLVNAADAVIPVPTVSRVHARIRKRDGEYYLADLNSRNGTTVNGRILKGDEEYLLKDEDQVDFAQARYIFVK